MNLYSNVYRRFNIFEIVILGFFDFNKNTKEEIIKREKTEIRDSNVENIINNEEPIDKTKSIETLV